MLLGGRVRGFLYKNRTLILIVLLALALRLLFFGFVRPWDSDVVERAILAAGEDSLGYHELALGIMTSWSYEAFGTFRTPAYPTFLAGLYAIFGTKPWIVLLVQVFVSCGTLILLYLWAQLLLGKRVAVIAALLYAIEPHAILYSTTLVSETMFAFVLLAAALALVSGLKRSKAVPVWVSGLLLGLASLIKPVCQYFPVVAVGIALSYPRVRWPLRIRASAGLVVLFLLAISPWLLRNQMEYGHAGLSTIRGSNLLFWNATFTEVAKSGRPLGEVNAEFAEIARMEGASDNNNPFDNSRIYNNVAMDYILANKAYYAKRHVKGIVNMFVNVTTARISQHLGLERRHLDYRFFAAPGALQMVSGFLRSKTPHEIAIAAIVGAFLLFTYILALIGGISMVKRRMYTDLLVTAVIITYFCALTGLIGLARYKLPLIPFYLTLSGHGVLWLQECGSKMRRRGRVRAAS